MRSWEISRKSHMWHFSFLLDWNAHLERYIFCLKPHFNRSSGSKVMSNWRILRTIENNRDSLLFLAISHHQCCRLPTDPARSQIMLHFFHLEFQEGFVRHRFSMDVSPLSETNDVDPGKRLTNNVPHTVREDTELSPATVQSSNEYASLHATGTSSLKEEYLADSTLSPGSYKDSIQTTPPRRFLSDPTLATVSHLSLPLSYVHHPNEEPLHRIQGHTIPTNYAECINHDTFLSRSEDRDFWLVQDKIDKRLPPMSLFPTSKESPPTAYRRSVSDLNLHDMSRFGDQSGSIRPVLPSMDPKTTSSSRNSTSPQHYLLQKSTSPKATSAFLKSFRQRPYETRPSPLHSHDATSSDRFHLADSTERDPSLTAVLQDVVKWVGFLAKSC